MDAVYCVNVRGGAHPALARSLLLPRSRGRVWRASHMAHKRPSSGVAEKCDKTPYEW